MYGVWAYALSAVPWDATEGLGSGQLHYRRL